MKQLYKRLPLAILSLIGIILLSSCRTSVFNFTIDYMKPAKITLDDKIFKVAVINNVDNSDKTMSSPTMIKQNIGIPDIYVSTITALATTDYFNNIIIAEQKWIDSELDAKTLSEETANKIIDSLNVDAVIALEQVDVEDYRSMENKDLSFVYETIVINPKVSIHSKLNTNYKEIVTKTDSLSILQPYTSNGRLISNMQLANENQLLKAIGQSISDMITPNWKKAKRHLFTENNLFAKSNTHYDNNNLEKAIEVCMKLYNKSNKKLVQMKAAHNISVFYELEDELEQAKEWGLKAIEDGKAAYKIDDSTAQTPEFLIENYPLYYHCVTQVEQISIRLKEKDTVKEQLNRFTVEI